MTCQGHKLGLFWSSRPVRKSGKLSKSGLSGNQTFSFNFFFQHFSFKKFFQIFFVSLFVKMFRNTIPDSVQSGRTCPANLGVQSGNSYALSGRSLLYRLYPSLTLLSTLHPRSADGRLSCKFPQTQCLF